MQCHHVAHRLHSKQCLNYAFRCQRRSGLCNSITYQLRSGPLHNWDLLFETSAVHNLAILYRSRSRQCTSYAVPLLLRWMLYLAIALTHCSNPTPFFSCRINAIALPCYAFPLLNFATQFRSTSMLCRRYSEHHSASASRVVAVPFPCCAQPCRYDTKRHHTNTQRLSTMTLLVSSPPRRHYDVHHRNVTALCNTVALLSITMPVLHCVQPYQYRTPCCATLRCHHKSNLLCALPRRYLAVHYFALPLPRPALPNTAIALHSCAQQHPCDFFRLDTMPVHHYSLLLLFIAGSKGQPDVNGPQCKG